MTLHLEIQGLNLNPRLDCVKFNIKFSNSNHSTKRYTSTSLTLTNALTTVQSNLRNRTKL